VAVSGIREALHTNTTKLPRDKARDREGAGQPLERRHLYCHSLRQDSCATGVSHWSCFMTQTTNRFFDEIGRLMNDAAGAAQGMKKEVDTLWRAQAEKILRDLDVVKREEFEAVKEMARIAREENEGLKARILALEAKLGVSPRGTSTNG
jgi:BMFP domain-containing protein YqiC